MHLTQKDFSLFGCTSTDILKEKLVCVCVRVCVQEYAGICHKFIVDLKTHTHPLTSPLQALCCGGNSVDADIITPRPLRNITDGE